MNKTKTKQVMKRLLYALGWLLFATMLCQCSDSDNDNPTIDPVEVPQGLFVVNAGNATCADILALIDQVRERVFRETGVELEPEVKYLR